FHAETAAQVRKTVRHLKNIPCRGSCRRQSFLSEHNHTRTAPYPDGCSPPDSSIFSGSQAVRTTAHIFPDVPQYPARAPDVSYNKRLPPRKQTRSSPDRSP